jgi:hypothetical protein
MILVLATAFPIATGALPSQIVDFVLAIGIDLLFALEIDDGRFNSVTGGDT